MVLDHYSTNVSFVLFVLFAGPTNVFPVHLVVNNLLQFIMYIMVLYFDLHHQLSILPRDTLHLALVTCFSVYSLVYNA